MALEPGVRLGPYEIVSLRGKGGMGEVYRARDVRLEREVAIKVLPRELAEDPHLRERLRREAKTISQLRHPHICTLHDIGDDQGLDYLVMEYLEGETLEDRVSRGALPLDEVITIGGQIAEAVAAAHSAGVIHRDLKPGNVMLTRDGAKVLDFGLAKGPQAQAAGVGTESPTVTQPLTSAGSLIGTLLYMSPEQLEGKVADARSDLWALGAMLYQMVTGTKPFTGGSKATVMAAILTARPRAVSELAPSTPARLDWLIERCLEKSPERRWQSARDLALELGSLARVSESPLPGGATGRIRRRSILLALGAAIGVLIGLGISALLGRRVGVDAGGPQRETWTTIRLDSTDAFSAPFGDLGLSPDGRTVLVGKSDGNRQRRSWGSLDSIDRFPLPDTIAYGGVAFSPDGRQLAFVDTRGTLRTMPLGGEPGPVLAENAFGASFWAQDGYIYYYLRARNHYAPNPTWRVRSTGGQPEPVHKDMVTDLLPMGRTMLTTWWNYPLGDVQNVVAVDVGTGKSQVLTTGRYASYVDPGFLIFCRDEAVWAAPIDIATGQLRAPARSFEEVSVSDRLELFCRFAVSRSGNLLYVPRRETGRSRLVWVARNGTVEPAAAEIMDFHTPFLSLDGRQVSVAVHLPAGSPFDREQWTLDLATGSWSRQAQSGYTSSAESVPPDGREIVFFSNRDGGIGRVFLQPADRSAAPTILWPDQREHSWLEVSGDGRQVILWVFDAPGFLVLDRDTGEVRSVIKDGAVYAAQFDRDGDWIVYARLDAGGSNLWLVPFPGPGEPRQITFDGGEEPRWSPAGDEIFYRSPTHVMAIPFEKSGGALVTGRPRPLFEDHFRHDAAPRGVMSYSLHPDGRFLMIENAEGREESLVLVENWRAKVVQAFARGKG